jgi:hypothetical protein
MPGGAGFYRADRGREVTVFHPGLAQHHARLPGQVRGPAPVTAAHRQQRPFTQRQREDIRRADVPDADRIISPFRRYQWPPAVARPGLGPARHVPARPAACPGTGDGSGMVPGRIRGRRSLDATRSNTGPLSRCDRSAPKVCSHMLIPDPESGQVNIGSSKHPKRAVLIWRVSAGSGPARGGRAVPRSNQVFRVSGGRGLRTHEDASTP